MNPSKMLFAGKKAPSFTLQDLAGVPHSLAEFLANGPVLLAFYKISCPVCQMTLPYLDRIGTESGLQVIAISQDSESGTERFRTKYDLKMLTLLDRDEENYPVSNGFGIRHVPSMFLVEPDGVISHVSEGFVKADLEEIGKRANTAIFHPNESVPAWRAG